MAQRLSGSGSLILYRGRMVKYKASDVLEVGAKRLAGKVIANFNEMVCSIDYDYHEDEHDDENDDDIDEEVCQFFISDYGNED